MIGRGNQATSGLLSCAHLISSDIYFEQALGRIHVRIVAQLTACLLQVLDALLTLTKGLVAARQVVFGNYGELNTRFVSSCGKIHRARSLGRIDPTLNGNTDAGALEDLVDLEKDLQRLFDLLNVDQLDGLLDTF